MYVCLSRARSHRLALSVIYVPYTEYLQRSKAISDKLSNSTVRASFIGFSEYRLRITDSSRVWTEVQVFVSVENTTAVVQCIFGRFDLFSYADCNRLGLQYVAIYTWPTRSREFWSHSIRIELSLHFKTSDSLVSLLPSWNSFIRAFGTTSMLHQTTASGACP